MPLLLNISDSTLLHRTFSEFCRRNPDRRQGRETTSFDLLAGIKSNNFINGTCMEKYKMVQIGTQNNDHQWYTIQTPLSAKSVGRLKNGDGREQTLFQFHGTQAQTTHTHCYRTSKPSCCVLLFNGTKLSLISGYL